MLSVVFPNIDKERKKRKRKKRCIRICVCFFARVCVSDMLSVVLCSPINIDGFPRSGPNEKNKE